MLKKVRLIVFALGVLVSWSTTINAFIAFYNIEGTIFKFQDCALPNPITTPCFWGALAFLAGLIWSYKLLKKENKKQEKYMLIFLVACVLFAWGNFAVELKGVPPTPGNVFTPCPATTQNPFLSACFFGSVLFSLALVISYRLHTNSISAQNL